MRKFIFLFVFSLSLLLFSCCSKTNSEENATANVETNEEIPTTNVETTEGNSNSTTISSEFNLSVEEFSLLFSYEINNNLDITITKYLGDETDVKIPNTVDNKYIVHTIKSNAFNNTLIENVLLPSSLVSLESDAFINCHKLKIVVFDDGYTYNDLLNQNNISKKSKDNNSNDSCTNIEENTFNSCPELELVTISNNIKKIDKDFYNECDYIQFDSNNTNGYYTVKDGILYSNFGTELFRNPSGNPTEIIEILEGVTTIRGMAFWGCNKIKKIILPKSLKNIESGAFSMCPMLEKIEFTEGCEITSIGDFCFSSCPKLNEIKFPSIETIPDQCFQDSSLEKIIIPATVKAIGEGAFSLCKNLKTVIFEENSQLTCIENHAFYQCVNLENIELPDSLISINQTAFYECENLKNIFIPKNVKIIENSAFFDAGLTEIIFEDDSECESIGDFAFWGCSVSEIVIPKNISHVGDYAFTALEILNLSNTDLSTVNFNEEVHVKNSVNESTIYDFTESWFVFSVKDNKPTLYRYIGNDSEIILPNDYKGKEYGIYHECFAFTNIKITSLYISKGVNNITYLHNIYDLETIVVDENNPYYDSRNNSNCVIETSTDKIIKGCKNSIIPKNIKQIGDFAFQKIKELKSIHIPRSIEYIGDECFGDCENLTNVIFEKDSNCTWFGVGTFSNSAIKEFEIPDKITSLKSTFNNCAHLTKLYLGENISSLNSIFTGCNSLSEITINPNNDSYIIEGNCIIQKSDNTLVFGYGNIQIPNYVKRIDDFSLTSKNLPLAVTIPASVEEIGYQAFGDSNVAVINFESNSQLNKIESYAFASQNLISITIPENVSIIEENALQASSKLIEVINLSNIDLNTNQNYYFGTETPKTISTEGTNIELIDNKYYMYEDEYNYYLVACVSENKDVLRLPEMINERKYWVYNSGIQYYNVESLIIPEGISLGGYAFLNCNIKNIYCEVYTQPLNWDFSWNYGVEDSNIYWSNQWTLINDEPTIFTNPVNVEGIIPDLSININELSINNTSATFLIEHDDHIEISTISLIYDNKFISTFEPNDDEKEFSFNNLASGKEYYIEVKYQYNFSIFGYELTQIKYAHLKFETIPMEIPSILISNVKYNNLKFEFDIEITDKNNILGITNIVATDGESVFTFNNISSENHYSIDIEFINDIEIIIKYNYDLNDFTGIHYDTYNYILPNSTVNEIDPVE